MKHNLHGDVSKQDLELAEELLEMEAHFDENGDHYPPAIIAKLFVCCAHDWYDLGDNDKGATLLEKAESICPGYFDNQMIEHIEEDSEFAYLVESLTEQIIVLAKSIVG